MIGQRQGTSFWTCAQRICACFGIFINAGGDKTMKSAKDCVKDLAFDLLLHTEGPLKGLAFDLLLHTEGPLKGKKELRVTLPVDMPVGAATALLKIIKKHRVEIIAMLEMKLYERH